MPASRRARAMILAPRSCPSRPGLATTTRILRLDSGCSAALSVVACRDRESAELTGGAAATAGAKRPDSTRRAFLAGFDRGPACQLALGQPLAEHLLVELPHACLRHRLDERELVRDPPLGDLAREVLPELLGRAGGILGEHHAGERPLGPALVRLCDHRRLRDRRVF